MTGPFTAQPAGLAVDAERARLPLTLPRYTLFAAMLAAAGLPIYLHAPKVYADTYGLNLATLGLVLAGLRLIDVVQDPLLGWIAGRLERTRPLAAAVGCLGLALGMAGLFAMAPPLAPLLWFSLSLCLLFTSYSFLTILFYAQGIGEARVLGENGHVRLAAWREVGALIGVCLASIVPAALLLAGFPDAYFWYAAAFSCVVVLAALAMRPVWFARSEAEARAAFNPMALLGDRRLRFVLLIGLVNASPVAITSALFLFFVEYRLGAPGWEGAFLVAFFLSAALGAPLFSLAARRWGTVPVLAAGMALSILSFSFAYQIGQGDLGAYLAICIASGAALGGDMTLLPALFAERVAELSGNGGQAFGLWSFCAKLALAVGALTLTGLGQAEFGGGVPPSEAALARLSFLYALVPCLLKAVALGLLGLFLWRGGAGR